MSTGANYAVEAARVSTVVDGGFSPGTRCPTKVFVPAEQRICYTEPRTSVPGQVVQAYGGVIHDGIVEPNISSPPVTL